VELLENKILQRLLLLQECGQQMKFFYAILLVVNGQVLMRLIQSVITFLVAVVATLIAEACPHIGAVVRDQFWSRVLLPQQPELHIP
jgi:hypothetical protein